MEWSDEMVVEFLENFEAEPIIWDPKNINHKKKHLVGDAWRRLKSKLSFENSITIEELKKKKDSLVAYYRIHLNKMKNCRKSGMGAEETYKTNWFAFSTMNRFLAPVYLCSATINTEELIEKTVIADESSCSPQRNQSMDGNPMKKKRQQGMSDLLHAKKRLDDAYEIIKERATLNKPERVHECDLYAQLLAEKLKKLDEERRIVLMHNIDMLVFQEIMSVKAQERAASEELSYSTTTSPSNQEFMLLHSQNSPLIIHSSSIPNENSVQSPQSAAPSSCEDELMVLQSQHKQLQYDQNKVHVISQEIIRPREDILPPAYHTE